VKVLRMSERIKDLIRELHGRVKTDDVFEHAKRTRATKRGPGRYHCNGTPAFRSTKDTGIGAEWLGQRENAAKNSERALKRQLGARQLKLLQREQRKQRVA